jgi:hypothetical protein
MGASAVAPSPAGDDSDGNPTSLQANAPIGPEPERGVCRPPDIVAARSTPLGRAAIVSMDTRAGGQTFTGAQRHQGAPIGIGLPPSPMATNTKLPEVASRRSPLATSSAYMSTPTVTEVVPTRVTRATSSTS